MDYLTSRETLIEKVLDFLREEQWHHQKVEGKPVIRAGFRGDHGTWVCFIRVDEDRRQILFHSLLGMIIPAQYRLGVMEYLNRVNFHLTVGNFEMDYDRGEVRFRTSLEAPDGEVSFAMLHRMAYTNVHTIDRYFPGVMAVLHSGLSPEAALARIDSQSGGGLPGRN